MNNRVSFFSFFQHVNSIFYIVFFFMLFDVIPGLIFTHTATYHPSRKLSKLDEPDIWDTAEEVGTSSLEMYSCRPLHMDDQRQND